MTTPQDPYRPGDGQHPSQQPGQYPQQPGQYPQQPGQYLPPPYPGQFPPLPGSPGGEVPAKSALPRILIAVLLVLVVALGVFLFVQDRNSDPTTAAVGECLKVEGTTTAGNPESEQIDCTDPAAQFTVTETGASVSCDPLELSYVQYRGDDESDVAGTVCLRPQFEVGECYVPPATETSLPKVGPCGSLDPTSEVTVESLNENTSDTSVCSNPRLSYTYTTRNEVVCFSNPT